MTSAAWTPASDANAATWDENKARADLQRNATTYNDSTVTYNSTVVYYNGYNPTTTTPEGENGTLWVEASE